MPRMSCTVSISSAPVEDLYGLFDVAVCEVDDRFVPFAGTRGEHIQNGGGPNVQRILDGARARLSRNEDVAGKKVDGYAVITPADYVLFARNLMHVVRPHCSSPPTAAERFNVRATYLNIMKFASKMGYRNVIVPLLGSKDETTAITVLQAILDCALTNFLHIMIADGECAGLRRLRQAFASLPGKPSELIVESKKRVVEIRRLLCDSIVSLPSTAIARKLLKFTDLVQIVEGEVQLIAVPCKQVRTPLESSKQAKRHKKRNVQASPIHNGETETDTNNGKHQMVTVKSEPTFLEEPCYGYSHVAINHEDAECGVAVKEEEYEDVSVETTTITPNTVCEEQNVSETGFAANVKIKLELGDDDAFCDNEQSVEQYNEDGSHTETPTDNKHSDKSCCDFYTENCKGNGILKYSTICCVGRYECKICSRRFNTKKKHMKLRIEEKINV